jgi:two-component system phosphate regulon response regulator PhoB
VRHVVYHFASLSDFAQTLGDADHELPLPPGEPVNDGEWVLAMFEVDFPKAADEWADSSGAAHRTTAAAARGVQRGGAGGLLTFEGRDWERLVDFADAGTDSSTPASVRPNTVPSDPPTQPSLPDFPGRTQHDSSRPSFSGLVASGPMAGGSRARILVVDDDRDIRDVVGAMLDAVGLTVTLAANAEEALEQVRSRPFDLLVLDWNLPGISGIELCRLIRRDPNLARLPVLFLTAHASSRDVVEAFASGADDYVVKPFRAPELGARIFGLLRRARMS